MEHYCEGDELKWENYECPYGCTDEEGFNGACNKEGVCSDSDGGKDYSSKGIVEYTSTSAKKIITEEDFCSDGTTLKEFFCEKGISNFEIYECPSKTCAEEKCVDCNPIGLRVAEEYCSVEGVYVSQKAEGELCENDFECTGDICEEGFCKEGCAGCELNGECYSFGKRVGDNFCSDTREFVLQKGEDEICDNNYECQSNLCVDNLCIDQTFLRRIINWFKDLFG